MHDELPEAITRPIITFGEYKQARRAFKHSVILAEWEDMKVLKRSSLHESQRWLADQLGHQAWGGYVDPNFKKTGPRRDGFLDPRDDQPVYFDQNSLWMAKWSGRVFFRQPEHAAAFTIAWRGRVEKKNAV